MGLFIQCRLRGRSKEREEDVSKNKSNQSLRGRDETKSKLGPLLKTTVMLQKDKDEMDKW